MGFGRGPSAAVKRPLAMPVTRPKRGLGDALEDAIDGLAAIFGFSLFD